MIEIQMTDAQFDKWCKKHTPIGCLHERHPKLYFAAVYETKEGAFVIAGGTPVDKGLVVRRWNMTTFIV